MTRVAVRLVIAGAVVLLLARCGGGSGPKPAGGSQGSIAGLVVKGPIQAATVTAYPLDPHMNRGPALATTASMPDGTFTLTVPPYNGALEIVAFGGSYPEEAVGVPVQLTHELTFLIPEFQSGSSVNVTVSPISSIGRSLAKSGIARGASLSDAAATAWTHLNSHFGGLDWRSVRPTSLTPSEPTTVTMSDATRAGLILAGISQTARTMAETSGLSPGTSVTGGTLSGAAADDALDGTLDGQAGAVALAQGSVTLTRQTLRRDLGQAVLKFVGSSANKTQLAAADVLPLATALAANGDPYLFCPAQTSAPSCAGGSLELRPPTITFLTPPSFVGSTTVTLQVQASDVLSPVTAVYAQTVSGTPVAATYAGGVWTLANVPLVEGPNLVFVWGVDASGTGSIGDAAQLTVTRDTVPPDPYVNSPAAAYFDERGMTLASAAAPPTYQFPAGSAKVAPIAGGGIWKAATRLRWSSQPTPAILEGPNPENIPFIQIAVPVSPIWSPTATATFSIEVASSIATGDLMPWKSPASTSSTELYDVPLSADLVPALASATSSPVDIQLTVQLTDAAGNVGSLSIALPPFHVIGPPLFVTLDAAYPTYNDPRSTFAYTLAGSTYSSLWNPIAPSFFEGQVRLVRYLLSNPAPTPIAVSAQYLQDPAGSWRAVERWSPFDAGAAVPSAQECWITFLSPNGCTYSVDGLSLYDDWEVQASLLNPARCPAQAPSPCGSPADTVHWLGSGTPYACGTPSTYWSSGSPEEWSTFSSTSVALGFFQGPLQQGGEVVHPPMTGGGMAIVPASSGSLPGTAVLYVTRPVSTPRVRQLAWNGLTGSNRYEAALAHFWAYASSHYASFGIPPYASCSYDDYQARVGAAWLTEARDEVYGSLSLATAGLIGGSTAFGEVQPQFLTTLAGPIGSH